MSDPANHDPMTASILAPTERQAWDWSLVLTSQGIESTIVQAEDNGHWLLVVAESDQEKAQEAIRQYRLENRGWAWRQPLHWQGVAFHWGALAWCAGLIIFHVLQTARGLSLQPPGLMSNQAVLAGQWWRLFTAITLHADAAHLASNVSVGFILLGLAMARFGAGWGLWSAYLAGAIGNLAGLFVYSPQHRSLGASGMVMGALGLTTVQSLALWRQSPRAARIVLTGLFTGLMLFILLGSNPDSDVVAHLGGFLAGGVLGGLLTLLPPALLQSARANFMAISGFLFTVVFTWWLAIRQ